MADVDEVREDDEYLYGESASLNQDQEEPQTTTSDSQEEPGSASGTIGFKSEIFGDGVSEGIGQEGDVESGEISIGSRKRVLEGDDDDGDGEAEVEGEGDGGESSSNDKGDSDEDDDSDDDGVKVTIGDLKSQSSQPGQAGPFSSKRPAGPPPDKKGKFSTEDFEGSGQINGIAAHEFNIDAIEEKPWRKPGADITDFFNYGFTEDTWKAYCDRQRRLRYESGNPIIMNPANKNFQPNPNHPNNQGNPNNMPPGDVKFIPGSQPIQFPKRFGMHMNHPNFNGPPVRRDGQNIPMRPPEVRENTIQVMTADRREYSRKQYEMQMHGPPMGMPPPPFDMGVPPPFPPPEFMGPPPHNYFGHPPHQPMDYFDEGPNYEDQQQWMDSQWEMEGEGQRMGPGPSAVVVSLTNSSDSPIGIPKTGVPPPPGETDGDNQD